MNEILNLILVNLCKAGIGALMFIIIYLGNMGLGAYKNVKINGYDFDKQLMLQSIVKYLVLAFSISAITIGVTMIPAYAIYVGVDIPQEYVENISSVVIFSAFVLGSCVYAVDAIRKIKTILGLDKENT